jgi:hypothetical protein
MSIFPRRSDPPTPPMPKVANMPAPAPQPPRPQQPSRTQEQSFADEALRAAQRHLDQVAEIARLGHELEDWRRRALMAEAEIKRLEMREAQLTDKLEQREQQLVDERDTYRLRLNSMEAQFQTAGTIILKCLDSARGNAETESRQPQEKSARSETPRNETPRNETNEPEPRQSGLPRVVTAGPRRGEDGT